jgi:hypothetical protein
MKTPSNPLLPFFTYGIFKPGQLCYSTIKDTVNFKVAKSVNGILKERDGIPLLVEDRNFQVRGYLLYFKKGIELNGYARVSEIEPRKVYYWGEIKTCDQIKANVLLGKKELKGSSDLEHISEWDGKNDPFFNEALEEVESLLKNNPKFDNNFKHLFKLHMAYTLLWSSIERYTSLRYHLGADATQKVYNIAKEKSFSNSLKKNVKHNREVYCTTNLKKAYLNPDDTMSSIKYYYQVRSNVVHRGKSVRQDFETLKKSTQELLEIFQDVLDESFNK